MSGAADLNTHRGVEFKRISTRRRFWISEDDSDFLTDLVQENDDRI